MDHLQRMHLPNIPACLLLGETSEVSVNSLVSPNYVSQLAGRQMRALAGVGLRREIAADLAAAPARGISILLEVAPENWIRVGGRYAQKLCVP